jgi:AraC-like DNA-binding protein
MFSILRKYNRSVIVAWLFSYVTVLMVPILISFVLYSFSYHQVKSETNRANALLLQQMEMSIDSKLKSLERLSLEIALNKGISAFSSVELPLRDHQYYDVFSISESLRTYKNANDSIEDIYVMYLNSDTVISTYGHTSGRGLYQKLRQNDEPSYEKWMGLFEQRYVNGYKSMEFQDGLQSSPVVVFAHSLVFNSPAQPPAVVLFLIKDSKLIESAPRQKDASMFIIDTDSRYISASRQDPAVPAGISYEQLQGDSGMIYIDSDAEQFAVSYITSQVTGWKYVSVLPAALFNEKMKDLRHLTWISIALSLFIGGVVTVLFLRRNYMPVQVMLKSLSKKFGLRFDGGGNEYTFLQGTIQQYFHDKADMQTALHKHRNTIRAHLLRRLLKGYADHDQSLHTTLPAHDLQFQSDRSVVLLISIDHYGKFEQFGIRGLPDQKQQMLYFILTNVLEDTASGEGLVFTTEMNDALACVVNFEASLPVEQEQTVLNRILAQVRDFMRKHIEAELTVAVGQVHSSLHGIALSYQEAQAALEYRIVMGSGQFIPYTDTLTDRSMQSRQFYYPLSVEQQFIGLVKSGSYDKAEAILDDIFQANFSKHPVSVPLAKCLMYNLASTMMNTLEEVRAGSKRTYEEHITDADLLLECDHVPEMKERMKQMLAQVCEWILTEKRNHHRYLIEDVSQYVQEHLYDPKLNISRIGDAFQMTPSYVSRLYKEFTGEALLDTINRLRLSKAKELLVLQKLTVNEIASQVGYADVSTFLRIFKKFEGVTPGKYQKAAL